MLPGTFWQSMILINSNTASPHSAGTEPCWTPESFTWFIATLGTLLMSWKFLFLLWWKEILFLLPQVVIHQIYPPIVWLLLFCCGHETRDFPPVAGQLHLLKGPTEQGIQRIQNSFLNRVRLVSFIDFVNIITGKPVTPSQFKAMEARGMHHDRDNI